MTQNVTPDASALAAQQSIITIKAADLFAEFKTIINRSRFAYLQNGSETPKKRQERIDYGALMNVAHLKDYLVEKTMLEKEELVKLTKNKNKKGFKKGDSFYTQPGIPVRDKITPLVKYYSVLKNDIETDQNLSLAMPLSVYKKAVATLTTHYHAEPNPLPSLGARNADLKKQYIEWKQKSQKAELA